MGLVERMWGSLRLVRLTADAYAGHSDLNHVTTQTYCLWAFLGIDPTMH